VVTRDRATAIRATAIAKRTALGRRNAGHGAYSSHGLAAVAIVLTAWWEWIWVATHRWSGQTRPMAAVDADDDGIRRFVVQRYAFDPGRHERRHQLVAAFDNPGEFEALIDSLGQDLEQRRRSGEKVDPHEHISGVVLEPGHRRRQQNARVLRNAIAHGVAVDSATWEQLTTDLPPGVAVLRATSTDLHNH
jgi:hypothetical protein